MTHYTKPKLLGIFQAGLTRREEFVPSAAPYDAKIHDCPASRELLGLGALLCLVV